MKYFTIFICVVAISIGAYLFLHYGSFQTSVESKTNVEEPITVSMIKKTVYIDSNGNKNEVVDPQLAVPDDIIETGKDGRALLEQTNGSISVLDYSTTFVIKSHKDDEHTSMSLRSGNVWSTVKKVFGKGEFYEIETQNAVAVVRGTSFNLGWNGTSSTLLVTDGTVAFVPIDSKTGERLFDKMQLVLAGKKAVIGQTGEVVISDINENDKKGEWYIFNNDVSTETVSTQQAENPNVKISNLIFRSSITGTSTTFATTTPR